MDYVKLIYHNLLLKTVQPKPCHNTLVWINNVLEESNIKINKPYPIIEDDYWSATHSIITVNKNYPDNPYFSKFALKHEVKHLINKDALKSSLFIGCSSVLVIFAQGPISFIFIVFIGYVINILYWKYYESEADRYAYQHATSRKEIEAAQQFFLFQKELIDDGIANIDHIINDVEETLQKELSCYERIMAHGKLIGLYILKYPTTVNTLAFFIDAAHPSVEKRLTMAEFYLNKWDNDNKNE